MPLLMKQGHSQKQIAKRTLMKVRFAGCSRLICIAVAGLGRL